jgi:sulfite reductase (ferredoxin)
LADRYVAGRNPDEGFKNFIQRIGKAELKTLLDDLTRPPDGDYSYFNDWGDPREYCLGDMGIGECAGEVVSAVEFELAAAERELFQSQLALERGQATEAGTLAYRAMLHAAKSLLKTRDLNISEDPDQVVAEFRAQFYDTQIFFDRFAGGKFANYLFDAHKKSGFSNTLESSRYLIDEAQLFIDAAHSCINRMVTAKAG